MLDLIVAVGWAVFWAMPVPRFSAPTSTVLLDRRGELLGASIASDGQWRFPALEQLPERVTKALVCAEDRRFWSHPGVDGWAVLRALVQDVRAGRVVSGASTLTMQVVRLSRRAAPRSFGEKVIESVLALRLEASTSKADILKLYLAQAPFGGNVSGAPAASWRWFGRDIDRLSWAEAATLAVLPNSPALIHPGRHRDALLAKRNHLLDALAERGHIDPETAALAKKEPLPAAPLPLPSWAPHLLARAQLANAHGEIPSAWVHSTLERPLQIRATEVLARHHARLAEQGIGNAAAVILDVETGQALAYVGNVGEAVDIVTAPRSTGSVLKPFLYAAMLDDSLLLPDQLVADIPTSMGGFNPMNFQRSWSGAVPAAKALARSLNVPAVRMLNAFGVDRFHALLRGLGMTTLHRPSSDYGLALILGGAEGTLWELTSRYAGEPHAPPAFFPASYRLGSVASGLDSARPERSPVTPSEGEGPRFLASAPGSYRLGTPAARPASAEPLLRPGAAWSTLQALLEVERPGAESAWRTFSQNRPIAWKTGTSYGFRDGWALGVTPRFAVGVWTGNASGEGRPELMGFTAAAPILFDLFDLLETGDWFTPPREDLVSIEICALSGMRAGPHCNHRRRAWVPRSGLDAPVCPYCTSLALDRAQGRRVHADCESVTNIQLTDWFVLPPSMEAYYRRTHPEYRSVPPWRGDCRGPAVDPGALSILYPVNDARLYVPVELSGQRGRVVFEAAHRNPRATLYWHIDDTYVGQTQDVHQLAVAPPPGLHRLTVVGDDGETSHRIFTVLDKASANGPVD